MPWEILDFGAERLKEREIKIARYKGRTYEVEKVGEEEVELKIWNIRREKWERERQGKGWMLPRPENFEERVSELKPLSTRFEKEREKEKNLAQA